MSVIKAKRKESQFEVFHHFYKLRREMTDLLLRDFGYKIEKREKRLRFVAKSKPYDEMTEAEKKAFDKKLVKHDAFIDWFLDDERQVIIDLLRSITSEIFIANSIYPVYYEELIERRIHQDRAIGLCFALLQELQYIIETLPVDINKYTRFADDISKEIDLIKGWRKSDNKFKRTLSDASTHFANVNNNGNANYNSASNSNYIRPTSKTLRLAPLTGASESEKGESVLPYE